MLVYKCSNDIYRVFLWLKWIEKKILLAKKPVGLIFRAS